MGKNRYKKRIQLEEREIRVSTTDPESGFMVRDGKPEGFFYLDHRTVDGKYNFITDVYVTPGNVHNSVPYLEWLDRQISRFGFQVEEVALDAGYLTMPICQGLKERESFAVIAHRSFRPKKGLFFKWQFKYIPEKNVYLCPAKQELSKRGRGFMISLIFHIQFPLSVYFPETRNPWRFSCEKNQGFVINLANPFKDWLSLF